MNRSLGIAFAAVLIALLGTGITDAVAQQNITGGVVAADGGMPLDRIQVDFLDGLNAGVVATTVTDLGGYFDSGDIPSGWYRVRFSDPHGTGSPGYYIPEIYDAEADDFCAGPLVEVVAGRTTTLREDLVHSDPRLVAIAYGGLTGIVVDAATQAPLHGIQVSVHRADNGQIVPLTDGTGVTDATGFYKIGFQVAGGRTVRIRFSDPTGACFPEFSGTTDLTRDEFCSAGVIGLDPQDTRTLDAFLDRVPAEQSTGNLLDTIETMTIPDHLKTVLGTPLLRAVDLLTDANDNNDTAVCAQLSSFMTRVDIEERKGLLTTADANNLRQSAMNAQFALNCR